MTTRIEQIAADWKECDGLALTPSEEGDHRRIGYLLTVATALAEVLRDVETWKLDHEPLTTKISAALALFDAEAPPHE